MKTSKQLKGALAGVILMAAALTSNAQKISEQELKVKVAEITSATAKVNSLKPVTFEYDLKKHPSLKLPAGNQYGFLTEGIKNQYPELVDETAKIYSPGKNNSAVARYDEVATAKLIPVLVAAIKEQQEQIDQLKKELDDLKETKAK
jgi:hypothetical protein